MVISMFFPLTHCIIFFTVWHLILSWAFAVQQLNFSHRGSWYNGNIMVGQIINKQALLISLVSLSVILLSQVKDTMIPTKNGLMTSM